MDIYPKDGKIGISDEKLKNIQNNIRNKYPNSKIDNITINLYDNINKATQDIEKSNIDLLTTSLKDMFSESISIFLSLVLITNKIFLLDSSKKLSAIFLDLLVLLIQFAYFCTLNATLSSLFQS